MMENDSVSLTIIQMLYLLPGPKQLVRRLGRITFGDREIIYVNIECDLSQFFYNVFF